ncbi:hypothetical protein C8Q74DRAFT_1261595 [Fomes fomentarius]|nr:hypothetical protein C8Q74DRAFT_1261595 [Fomes fomentarius]
MPRPPAVRSVIDSTKIVQHSRRSYMRNAMPLFGLPKQASRTSAVPGSASSTPVRGEAATSCCCACTCLSLSGKRCVKNPCRASISH